MRPTISRLLQATRPLQHENPLGLPKTGTIPRFQRGLPQKRKIKNVDKVIAVSSAKGGVGKSTIAANLALSLSRLGYTTGILDTDLFGPSIPTLFNLSSPSLSPSLNPHNQLLPLTSYGVKTMSIGYLLGSEDSALVWRGPMLLKAIQQLLHEVDWSHPSLDVLVLDLPPGTGDTQLSIAQQVVVDGAVIVTTPHTLAIKDAVKGVNMFRKVDIPILGVVQNMSVFCCPGCGKETHVFGGTEGVTKVCEEMDMEFLGDVPLHPSIGEDGGRGKPTVVSEPGGKEAEVFMGLGRRVAELVGLGKMPFAGRE
ncbi:P-loop containing nucleoside triphosphate hydrolase protein [Neurospora crassa]|uniref:Cytosolic Fe-S cluster assembling factor NBP35 n=1 Tax=Neurospora crassa (strain ATCC 24698 / 74-OR23-1A / CBS 708.71 / DSM 1257 / FGSC 987) TaxID=367110 RepID=Q7S6P7_NEUCR|nr:cytosolic Fe-S cluster assembling factor NBP35 [Neurospora crassa OR74A]EAA31178.1 cytosolic Fe-S cluster assembling factor NBP35 [Neurospora crassa OR74A]KHE88988.1 P-loop containing nucleoside triphosphate hydrolase protein [Neurospora crassa]|eukprot:XP_960414.1 cytosolic Fe-S cluster assembling factor NBP35 [Neurospora crassa OR74A]